MSFAPAKRSATAFSSINTTPLVDVMLVLLIIFMIAAPLLNHRIDFILPSKSIEINPARTDPLLIQLQSDGRSITHQLDGADVDRSELLQRLRDALVQSPERGFVLRADETMSYDQVANTLALIRHSGMQRGSFETNQ